MRQLADGLPGDALGKRGAASLLQFKPGHFHRMCEQAFVARLHRGAHAVHTPHRVAGRIFYHCREARVHRVADHGFLPENGSQQRRRRRNDSPDRQRKEFGSDGIQSHRFLFNLILVYAATAGSHRAPIARLPHKCRSRTGAFEGLDSRTPALVSIACLRGESRVLRIIAAVVTVRGGYKSDMLGPGHGTDNTRRN